MPRRKASDLTEGDATDPGAGRKQCEKRIAELKKARDERTQAIIEETQALLEDLQSRVQLHRNSQQQQGTKDKVKQLRTLQESIERRDEIEGEVTKLVTDLTDEMEALEDLMSTGFAGRKKAMQKILQKRTRVGTDEN